MYTQTSNTCVNTRVHPGGVCVPHLGLLNIHAGSARVRAQRAEAREELSVELAQAWVLPAYERARALQRVGWVRRERGVGAACAAGWLV